ncbi:hypothetical protein F4778DRAFT_757805 [Xylariomycetidae sp. FL2044]|nr:hypothetical protein F4778DRAFT_757805 [Xylariomycetidae sp. FL2044]
MLISSSKINLKSQNFRDISQIMKQGISAVLQHGSMVCNTPDEISIDHTVLDLTVRVTQLKDISYKDRSSYHQARRAKEVERRSCEKMTSIEPPMGRDVENLIMARRMNNGEAPPMPSHLDGTDNKKEWYEQMRVDSVRSFWIEHTLEERAALRAEAQRQPPAELQPLIDQIRLGDKSGSRDLFWEHQRDESAAAEPGIYKLVDRDIVIILDQDSELILCKFKSLFGHLYSQQSIDKVDQAVREWSSLLPLLIPDTTRHMVDEWIRKEKHPEMDLEKATTLQEIEQRHQCVVHYGTWAMRGHTQPNLIYKTPDALLTRGASRKVEANVPSLIFPAFIERVRFCWPVGFG